MFAVGARGRSREKQSICCRILVLRAVSTNPCAQSSPGFVDKQQTVGRETRRSWADRTFRVIPTAPIRFCYSPLALDYAPASTCPEARPGAAQSLWVTYSYCVLGHQLPARGERLTFSCCLTRLLEGFFRLEEDLGGQGVILLQPNTLLLKQRRLSIAIH